MSVALPPAPVPARQRTVLVGTALVCAATTLLMGSMLAFYLALRDRQLKDHVAWVPKGVKIPQISTNVMMCTMIAASIIAQSAVYALRRRDRQYAYVALGLTAVFGIAVLNAQVYTWIQMKMVLAASTYAALTYAITGTFFALVIAGVIGTLLLAFRTMGGRSTVRDTEHLASAAMFWHFLTAAYAAMWLVIYVSK